MSVIAAGGVRKNIKIYVLSPKLTYSMYVGDGALWLEKKISVDRWASTAGARRMGTDRNGNSLDRDFSTIPLP